jgi:3'-phosphoadenosine 5'-phosphosulfate synthase
MESTTHTDSQPRY